VADRARGALCAFARTDTSSDDGAHSEANRKAASKKAAKKPRKVGGKPGVGLFINESRGGVVVDDSSDEESDGETINDRDRAALRTLADDRNLRGTTAFRLCQAATAAETHPGWSGTGPHYTAWLNALGRTPSSPEAALGLSAPELAYLAMINGEQEFPILHNVHRWIASERGRSSLHNRIVAFEGEVMPQYNVPLLHHFAEEDVALLQLQELPTSTPSHAAEFYRDSEKTTISICARSHPLATIRAAQS
jgi:hypothetical protein